jgi:chromosome segregation protein
MSLEDVSEDAEKMYEHCSKLYGNLKEKLAVVSENRRRALEEVKERIAVWKKLLYNLVNDVNPIFNEILSEMHAIGRIKLVDLDYLEKAGLEILIGFRGSKPAVLDAYTQSGGERSVGVVSFLLALQQHIRSPLRAIDEFDIHLDPRNREAIYRFFVTLLSRRSDVQHIIITPSPIASIVENIHVITVQNVEGVSKAKALRYVK